MEREFVLVDSPLTSPLSSSATMDSIKIQAHVPTENKIPQTPPELDDRVASTVSLQNRDAIPYQNGLRNTQSPNTCRVGMPAYGDRKGLSQVPGKSCSYEGEANERRLESGLSPDSHEGTGKNCFVSSSPLLPIVVSPVDIQPPPPPPPPPPPTATFRVPPTSGHLPPATVPPGYPTRVKRRIITTVESAQQLRPTETPLTERIVSLHIGGVHQRAALNHRSASLFDFNKFLWLLRFCEVGSWHTRPSKRDLKRFGRLEAAGLGDEIPALLATSGMSIVPAPASILSISVGEVMDVSSTQHDTCWCPAEGEGPADLHCPSGGRFCNARNRQSIDGAFLTYYMVMEGEKATPEQGGAYGSSASSLYPPPPPPLPFGTTQQVSREKVFKIEKVGSREACLTEAYHTAVLRGWSTVFTCVVCGDPDLNEAKPGLEGFRRVDSLASLLFAEEDEGKMKIFF